MVYSLLCNCHLLRTHPNSDQFGSFGRDVRCLDAKTKCGRCPTSARLNKNPCSVCGLRRVVREPLMSREICERTQSARVKLTCARVKQLRLYSRLVWGASKSSYTILRSRGSWGGWVVGVWGVGGWGGGGGGSPPPPP